MMSLSRPPHSILIVPPHFIGDGVVTIPLVRAIRQQHPTATLGLVATPAMASLLKACPYLDHLHLWRKPSRQVWHEVQRVGYQAAILTRPSLSDALAVARLGIPQRVGYRRQRLLGRWYGHQGFGLTQVVDLPDRLSQKPQVRHLLETFLPEVGLTVPPVGENDGLELWPEADRDSSLAALDLAGERPYAVIHLVAASDHKAIDLDRMRPTLLFLHQQGLELVMTGPPEMEAVYQQNWGPVLQAAGVSWKNWAGRTTLPQLLSVLKSARLLVALDSAPSHMAAAVGTPAIVTIYGAINQVQWAPYRAEGVAVQSKTAPVFLSLPCRPCEARQCSHNQCRTDITSQHILSAVRQAIGSG